MLPCPLQVVGNLFFLIFWEHCRALDFGSVAAEMLHSVAFLLCFDFTFHLMLKLSCKCVVQCYSWDLEMDLVLLLMTFGPSLPVCRRLQKSLSRRTVFLSVWISVNFSCLNITYVIFILYLFLPLLGLNAVRMLIFSHDSDSSQFLSLPCSHSLHQVYFLSPFLHPVYSGCCFLYSFNPSYQKARQFKSFLSQDTLILWLCSQCYQVYRPCSAGTYTSQPCHVTHEYPYFPFSRVLLRALPIVHCLLLPERPSTSVSLLPMLYADGRFSRVWYWVPSLRVIES